MGGKFDGDHSKIVPTLQKMKDLPSNVQYMLPNLFEQPLKFVYTPFIIFEKIIYLFRPLHTQPLWACWCLQTKLRWILLWVWGNLLYWSSVSYFTQFYVLCPIFTCTSRLKVRSNTIFRWLFMLKRRFKIDIWFTYS